MGPWKKIMGFLGFGNHDLHEINREHDDENNLNGNNNVNSGEEIHHHNYTNLPRKGFSVPVQVPVDRAHQIGPVLTLCVAGDGGVQGLGWYGRSLKVDEDGDVADEFIDEIIVPETSLASNPNNTTQVNQSSKFQVKLNTKPAKARNPVLSREGTIQQFVEFRGRYLLV